MRKWENVTINNKYFELNTKDTQEYASIDGYGNIWEAYERPSHTKEYIYTDWARWFNDNKGWCTVVSRNSNFFSIAGYVKDETNNTWYYCYITPSHNKAWRAEGVEA